MKREKLAFLSIFLCFSAGIWAQTNPTAQSLPVNINFGTANFTPPFANTAAWTGDGTRPYATQTAAENSLPGADMPPANLFAATPSAAPTGGQYGDGAGSNGRLTIATSANATAGTSQFGLAINTTSATGITISYDLSLQVPNPRVIGVVLQYRVGTTGAFTTIAGSPVSYTSGSTNGGDADGNTDWDNYSFPLPAAAENQPVVQLRWAVWRSGAGNSSGIGIDNISVSTTSTVVCTTPAAQPTTLNLSNFSATQVNGTFTASVPAADNYLVVRSASPTLSASPANGITYTAGQALGGGTVIQFAAGTSFSDAGLAANTLYYYFVFAVNSENCINGPAYLTTAPLSNSITTPPLAPCVTPAAPTGISLTPGVTGISVSFSAAAGATKYLGVLHTAATLAASPANTTVYTNGQTLGGGTVRYYGAATNFVLSGLNPGTTYYVFIFAAADGCTGEPVYNTTSLTGSTTTLSGTGIPPGYYSTTTGLLCAPLKTALFNVIRPTVSNPPPTYDGICDIYTTTDYRKSDDLARDIIWDMYSDNPVGPDPYEFEYGIDVDGCGGSPNNPPIPGTQEGRMYNREHSFPRSWFGGAVEPMNSDIFHIYPTDKEVNNRRASFPYGEVASPTWTSLNGSKLGPNTFTGYSGTVFEPRNEYKGDFARSMFYMAVAYETSIDGWQPNANEVLNGTEYQAFDDWYLQLLFKWHTQDPVSQKEIDRNNAVYVIQGNRNPFIDNPAWVYDIWSCTGAIILPVTLNNFTAHTEGSFAVLNWEVGSYINFSHFEIERSRNGISFNTIARVNRQNGSDNYRFNNDINGLNGNIYYRIKMVDRNGATRYSEIRLVKVNAANTGLLVYPNPASGGSVTLGGLNGVPAQVLIYDSFGRLWKKLNGAANNRIDVTTLPAGKYAVVVNTATGQQKGYFVR